MNRLTVACDRIMFSESVVSQNDEFVEFNKPGKVIYDQLMLSQQGCQALVSYPETWRGAGEGCAN